jgi:recombination associated protein RdgC
MGLLKGNITFSRFRILGSMPDSFDEFFAERIHRFAFQNIWRTGDEKIKGWISIENCVDSDFPYASYAQGNYLLFSLRIDRKSIPPSLLKIRLMEDEQKKLKESGQKKLYREQREAIRDSVRLELLAKALPVPSFYDICWSVQERMLTFCSLSDKAGTELQELFRDSFSLTLAPYTPWDIENLPFSQNNNTLSLPHLPAGIDPGVIGREFLTWLWFKSEERNGRISNPKGGEDEIIFLRRLVLESGEGEYIETVVCQGLHAGLKEGKEALRQGKKITASRLRLSSDADEWEFTFKADRFHFQTMKLPAIPENDDEDREGQIIERIYLIEKAAATMDHLFATFFALRRTEGWVKEQARIQKWLS